MWYTLARKIPKGDDNRIVIYIIAKKRTVPDPDNPGDIIALSADSIHVISNIGWEESVTPSQAKCIKSKLK